MEDSVAESKRDSAELTVSEALLANPPSERQLTLCVRVHPNRLRAHIELAIAGGADLIYLPKATLDSVSGCIDQIAKSDAQAKVVALIESAEGLSQSVEIASIEGVHTLALGEADLFSELGMDPHLEDAAKAPIRTQVVVATAAGGLVAPTAPVSVNFKDLQAFEASCRYLHRLGFGARSAIHPDQVPIINEVFSPSEEEVHAAKQLVADFDQAVSEGIGVIVDADGNMVDEAVVRAARRLLS